MAKGDITYIGRANDGRLAFFKDEAGQTLIDYQSNRVDVFIGEKESSMRAYREGGKIEAHLSVAYGGGMPTLYIEIPCVDRPPLDATIDDLILALKEGIFNPEDIKLDKTLEGIFKLFLIREVI